MIDWRGRLPILYAVLDRGVAAGAGFLVIFVLTRLLGPENYGIFVLAESIHILLVFTIEQAPGQALIFFSANKPREELGVVLGSVLAVKGIFFIVLYALLLLLAGPIAVLFDEPAIAPLLRLLPIATLGLVLVGTVNQVRIGQQNLREVLINDSILFGSLGFAFLVCRYGELISNPLSAMVVLVSARLVAGLVVFARMGSELNVLWRQAGLARFVDSIRYSLLCFANTLGVFINTKIDVFFLGIMSTKHSVGVYGACVAALAFYRLLADAANLIVFPRVSARRALPAKELRATVKRLYLGGATLVMLAGLPASLAIFLYRSEILTLVFGPSYVDGSAVLVVIGIWGLLLPFYRLAGSTLNGLGFPGDNAKNAVLVAGLNMGFNLPLIYFFDMLGATIASLLSNLIGMTLLARAILRRLREAPELPVETRVGS